MTINVGDEWNLTRTTDGSAVIVMGHGIQQKVPKEYFELVGRKVRESKSMKLTKARLQQIIKEEIGAWTDIDTAYHRLANRVGDLIRAALEKDGLDPSAIQDAIGEALDEELGVAYTRRLFKKN